jgi:hypothetical protein
VRRLWFSVLLSVLFRTELSAATHDPVWRQIALAPCDVPVSALGIDPVSGGLAYAGNNCGLFRLATAEPHGWAPTSITSLVYSIVVDPTNASTLYIISLGAPGPLRGLQDIVLSRSTDAGETHKDLLLSIRSVVIDPSNPTTAYAGAVPTFTYYALGIYKTEDGGAHWMVPSADLSSTGVTALAIDRTNPTVLYAGSYGAIFKSVDAGTTWSTVNEGGAVSSLAVDPASPSIVYAGFARLTFPSTPGVLRTRDAGATWSLLPIAGYGSVPVVVDPLTRTIFVATGSGVLRSDDEGEHWTTFSDGLTGFPVASLALGPRYTLYAGTRDGVFAISTLARVPMQRPSDRTVRPR